MATAEQAERRNARKAKAKASKAERIPVRQTEGGAKHSSANANEKPSPLSEERRNARKAFKRRASKVLYFINGSMPTAEDFAAAEAVGPGVVFRNARKIVPGAPLENCDGVAGNVPADYAATFPEAGEAFETEDGKDTLENVERPDRSHPQASGNNPDDVRPGTVNRIDPETGKPIEHASGTGSEKPGGIDNLDAPGAGTPPEPAMSREDAPANAWKSTKVDS